MTIAFSYNLIEDKYKRFGIYLYDTDDDHFIQHLLILYQPQTMLHDMIQFTRKFLVDHMESVSYVILLCMHSHKNNLYYFMLFKILEF